MHFFLKQGVLFSVSTEVALLLIHVAMFAGCQYYWTR